jgi:Lysine methyltransferase
MSSSSSSNALFAIDETKSDTYGEWTLKVSETIDYRFKYSPDKCVSVLQNTEGKGELGTRVWDSGLLLCAFLEFERERGAESRLDSLLFNGNGKDVVELGSGCGLTGIVLAALGTGVVLSDKDALRPLLECNVQRNREAIGDKIECSVHAYCWGAENTLGRRFRCVVGADLTYDIDAIEPLLDAFDALLDDGGTVVLAYGEERYAMTVFFERASQRGWRADIVDKQLMPYAYVAKQLKHTLYTTPRVCYLTKGDIKK